MSDDVSDEIMGATYRALCECGYAELTMQDIADRTDKSKAALHYHYDSKHDLLLSFLDFLYERFTDHLGDPPGDDPAERLLGFVDDSLHPPKPESGDQVAFRTALLELKAQAPYDDEIRQRLARFDDHLFETIRAIVADGVESGAFAADVDPDDAARFLVTVLDGARTKQIAVGQDIDATQRSLESYVERSLLAEERATDERSPPPGATSE